MKQIELSSVNWRDFIPAGAEDLYHVMAVKTGYLHDVDSMVILTPIRNGEEPRGWSRIDREVAAVEAEVVACWEMAQRDWAYSFKPLR
jgi:hypothetical protein